MEALWKPSEDGRFKMKFEGAWRQLRAYMDQLETFPHVQSNKTSTLAKFADLVPITVVK